MGTLQDTARDFINRGADVMNDLASSAGEAAAKAKIRVKMTDLSLEKDNLMKKLGQAVYDDIKDDANYNGTHADLLKSINEVIAHKEALQVEFDKLNAEKKETGGASSPVEVDSIVVNDAPQPPARDDAQKDEKDAE